ncbi:MAG: hypothetical protein U1E53_18375 [Dongiaceae bacterium]
MSARPPGRGTLGSGTLIEASFRISWDRRDQLLRIGVVPAALSLALQILQLLALTDFAAIMMLTFAEVVPVSMFSVAGYRLLLLGDSALPPGLRPSFGRREVRYMLLTLGIAVLGGLVLGGPLSVLVPVDPARPVTIVAPLLVALALGLYGLARLSLIFPGCAVDAPVSMIESVRRTAGVGGQLALALLATGASSVLATTLAGLLLAWTGLQQAAPLASAAVMTLLAYAGVAIMLVPPALVFRELSGWRGPPQPPGLSVVS